MGTPKDKKKKKVSTVPVYDEICYVANNNPIPPRCQENQLHLYSEAWLGYSDYAEYYYKHIYKKSKKTITSIGSFQSFEGFLRGLYAELSKNENKNKLIGDLIILTHGIEHYDKATGITETVKINFPLLSAKDTEGRDRPILLWWKEVQDQFDAEEINKLLNSNSDYYKYVDGTDKKDGLISVIAKSISNYMDGETHVWFVGCNIGKNRDLMKAMRKLFNDKPAIYAFNKRHFIKYYFSGSVENCTSYGETIIGRGEKKAISLWTKQGLKSIEHEP
jgi:hypothetical protein